MAKTGNDSASYSAPAKGDTAGMMSRQDLDTANNAESLNEASPLLHARSSDDSEHEPLAEDVLSIRGNENGWLADQDPDITNEQETKSSWYMFLLTLGMGGLTIAWSVETSNFSPYLLSLGVSKSSLAIIWIAGPLSGVLVQPYVGVKSDQCRSRFGKRRPFMIGGAIATALSLIILAWTKEIICAIFHGIFGSTADGSVVHGATIVLAIVMVYVLDFAINVVQAGVRAFIVDNVPPYQQDSANAWASRAAGVGHIVGHLFGKSDLPTVLWFFGNTQVKVLCVIASLGLLITLGISCSSIHERDPRQDPRPTKDGEGAFALFRQLYRTVRKLPAQIKAVCLVQFFAWIGWFPFLFYITTYIGEIYVEPIFAARPDMTPEEIDEAWQQATRIGTRALFVFAIVSFVSSVVLPFFVASSIDAPKNDLEGPPHNATKPQYGKSHSISLADRLSQPTASIPSFEILWLTLRRTWLLSHLFFAALMGLTFLVRSTTAATILVSLIGIPWAITNWAPFALIATEIGKRERTRHHSQQNRHDEISEHLDDGTQQAGVVLGIHNVSISAPQILATLVSSAIFSALQKPRGSVGDESVAWVLRFGGLAALVAAWCCRRVAEER